MAKNLVIVESPSKGKTIEKYLGKEYKVLASFGHVRDLPEKKLGIDVERNFAPSYVIPPKSKKIVRDLKKATVAADNVFLATDYDREGEAIAWHIVKAVDLDRSKDTVFKRITFTEITKPALQKAIESPRGIDQALVDAQQARRVLDRLVGYKLSPFLWKKLLKGLSAGRVQSVAVRIIVDREREIKSFKPQEYWQISGIFSVLGNKFEAQLRKLESQKLSKLSIKNKKQAEEAVSRLRGDSYKIAGVDVKEEKRYPFAPYTTSTLQQDASRKLGFSSRQTMRLAQELYEAGLITYMRTDSVNMAISAVAQARRFIKKKYGSLYLPLKPRVYKTRSKGAQEAHEAIRPVNCGRLVADLKDSWSARHKKLYELIWRRALSSQMKPAIIGKVRYDIEGEKGSLFSASGQKIKFEGFLKIYKIKFDEASLPQVKKGDSAKLEELRPTQHFTQPPPRYNEASLVKTLEEYGIGRPSTYAPTISTIIDRGYVLLENKVFIPQEIGFLMVDLLKQHFPDIVDISFTAKMEKDLDEIAKGKKVWTTPIKIFWNSFARKLEAKTKKVEKKDLTKKLNEKCPECGKPLLERMGRYGKFIACSGFPDCRYSKQLRVSTGVKCPECAKGELVERRTKKRNRVFWGCSRFPKCKYATWDSPLKKESSPEL